MRNVLTGGPLARRWGVWTVLVAALALFVAGVPSASASVSVSSSWGTPSWSVTSISSTNPFGGTSFERNAFDNKYSYSIENKKGLSEGETLVCRSGEWSNMPTGFAFQWLRNGVAIGGATSATYTLAAGDKGSSLQCQVTATNASALSAVTALMPVVIPPVPVSAAPVPGSPSVSGAFNVGVSLTCSSGTWGGSPTFAYKWFRNGIAIGGAEESTYTLQLADKGAVVQCQVTGANGSGKAVQYSSSKVVVLAPPVLSAAPVVSGTVGGGVGSMEVCDNNAWQGRTGEIYAYRWLRNGQTISGATGYSYTLTASDEGKVIQCFVSGESSAPAGNAAATSTVVVAPAPGTTPPTPPVSLTIAAPTGSGGAGSTRTCAANGTWTGSPTFTYAFLVNGHQVSTPSASNVYTLQAADVPGEVQCEVIGTNAGGSSVSISATSQTSPAIPIVSRITAPVPSVNGTGVTGSALSCSNGTWSGSPTFTYQWLRGGSAITGATSSSYTPVGADNGSFLQCEVTATNSDGSAGGLSKQIFVGSVAPSNPPPLVSSVTVSGIVSVGSILTCSPTAQAGPGTPLVTSVQWLRNGVAISGATSSTYTLVGVDAGKDVQCQATATNPGGSFVAVDVGSVVSNLAPVTSGTTKVAGVTLKSGEKLSCTEGAWSENPTEYSYQWLRNGTAISGATAKEYTLVAADQGAAVQCRVTAGNASPDPVVAVSTSLLVSPVSATTPPMLAVAPELAGATIEEGKELSCSTGVWTGSPVLTRQWLRNGVAIAGAIGETYKLGGAAGNSGEDSGKAIQCQIIASNAGGISTAYTTRDAVKTEPTSPNVPSFTAEPKIGSSPTTVTDVLPAGMTLGHPNSSGPFTSPAGWACVAATVRCTRSEPMLPGEMASFTLVVRASEATLNPASNEIVVSGGGAPSASLKYSNEITPAEQFGFESFWASVTEELGTPFSQSVGHPFEATTTLVFKTTTNENGQMVTAGGDAKNIEVLLPPGFVGSPELRPTCEVGTFEKHGCPADDAVGFVWAGVGLSSGISIVGGKRGIARFGLGNGTAGIVYNLVPPPGSPAAFGFAILSLNVYLKATVRSDSDYGITVIAPDTPMSPELIGSTFTFCANGVSQGEYTLTGTPGKCKAVTPNSNSFLQTPAKCTGTPPVTTVQMNSWQHPDRKASISTYTGTSLIGGAPSVGESLVTGCENLSFEPSIEPVPLNTEADAGTGVSVFLRVPQHVKVEENVGSRLSCLHGEWEGAPTGYTYQWYVNGVAGATGQTYVVKPEDAGKSVQCLVKATNAGATSVTLGTLSETTFTEAGAEVATPTTVPPVPAGALPKPPTAGVAEPSGTATVGSVLACAPGTWTGSSAFTYAWLRNGTPIAGATGSTYTLQAEDSKTNVQCLVIATNAAGVVGAVSANKSIAASPVPPVRPSIVLAEVSVASTPNTPEIKDTSVTFPEGLSLSPSAADGLEGCSDAQFAKHSLVGATCPDGSQIGTVKITTPLLTKPLEGQLFLGTPECGDPTPCNVSDASEGRMFRLFIQAIDPTNGVVVKIQGVTKVDPVTGQVSASFDETPQLPFEVLELKLKNGPRAPLATPQTCGTKATKSEFVPWSTGGLGGISGTEEIGGTPNAVSETAFVTDWDGHGGACPETLPFSPTFKAGTTSTQAAASGNGNELSVTMARGAKEQDLGGISLHMPSGLLGSVSLVKLCEEPQAALGTCSADSRIGTVTAGAGPGSHPYFVKGSMYLTSSYKGAPFGLSIVVPTKAGPFNLGNVVVRATVNVDPHTAELTVVSDPLPQILDGIPLRLREVNVMVDREGFIQNPTSCTPETITATISGAAPRERLSETVKTSNVSSPFDVGGCANVPFKPAFTASTQANLASRKNGASLHVDLSQKHGEANIHSVRVELPIQLPARLTTLQKACTEQQFATNPAGCPSASLVGSVVAHTPILSVPLAGPAYFVSHGGAKFPELILVLQGDGVTIELDGETFIDPKTNVTSSTFKTVPDAPVSTFELTLPTGPYSALAAPGGLQCGKTLLMPTVITGQNGMQIKQNTTIKTVGCTSTKKLTNAQKLKSALKACKKLKSKTKRATCETKARKKYAKTAKKSNKSVKKGVTPGK